MSTAYETHGRVAQKQRTRAALVAAARELLSAGATPTVEAVADAASISRTTAYRYFPNQRVLLAAAHPEIDLASLLPPDAPADDAGARLELVVRAYLELILRDEQQQRAMLRLSLDPDADPSELPLRQGRVVTWLTDALAPLRSELGDDRVRLLALAIRSATGIEALVWLVDVAGLSRREAVEVMRGTALTLYRAAVDEAGR